MNTRTLILSITLSGIASAIIIPPLLLLALWVAPSLRALSNRVRGVVFLLEDWGCFDHIEYCFVCPWSSRGRAIRAKYRKPSRTTI